jgi:hypothetical protein
VDKDWLEIDTQFPTARKAYLRAIGQSGKTGGRKAAEKGLKIRPLPNQPGGMGQESLK